MIEPEFTKKTDLNIRFGSSLTKLRAVISNVMKLFQEAGALELDMPSLLDSHALIDLYGEDIRNQAYTIGHINREKILRPDFTVPIVEMHIATEQKEAKYSYCGPVWRSQLYGSQEPTEYYQAGFEYFHQTDSARADAEIFELFQHCTRGVDLDIELGDVGILRAVVSSLDISDNKRSLLLRHLWRPDRFIQLIRQLSEDNSISTSRSLLFESINNDKLNDYVNANGPKIGLRTLDEIRKRSEELLKEELARPISSNLVKAIEDLLALQCPLSKASSKISQFFAIGNELRDVSYNLDCRIDAMSELGIDVKNLNFLTNLSRTSLEYYDGFVFSTSLKDRPNLPPVVQGGRYNALTKILGKGTEIPAVGGIVRPEILASVR